MQRFVRLLFGVFLFATSEFVAAQNNVKEGNEILWSVDRPLTWDDFKGPNVNAQKKQAAIVGYKLLLETKVNRKQDSVHVTVKALMLKNKSWKLKSTNSNYCLKHEQLHFDIAELYARKLRKQISEIIPDKKDFNDKLNKLLKSIEKELDATESEYDRETNHSLITEKQEEWDEKIAGELKNYETWTNTEIWIRF